MTKDEFVSRLLLVGFETDELRDRCIFTRYVDTDRAIYDVWVGSGFSHILVALDSIESESIRAWYYRVPDDHPDPYAEAWSLIESPPPPPEP